MSLHIVAPGQPVALGHCEIFSGSRVPTLWGLASPAALSQEGGQGSESPLFRG